MGYVLHYNPSTGTISFWPKIGVAAFDGVVDADGLDITWPVSSIYTTQTSRVAMEAGSGTCDDDATNYLIWSAGTTLSLGTTAPATGEILVSTITTVGGDITDITDADLLWRTIHLALISKDWKLMKVTAVPAGDGLYTCRVYELDATEWDDEEGTSKVVASADEDDYTVLNIAEHDPESGYIAHLQIGDLMFATLQQDDEANARWVGMPLRQYNADRPRIAYCTEDAPDDDNIACVLDVAGGTAIDVYCYVSGSGPNLCYATPLLKSGDALMVTKVFDGTNDYWRCLTTFSPYPVRSAKIQAAGIAATLLTCKLLNAAGSEYGSTISVYPRTELGSNDLDGDVWPDFAAGDNIICVLDIDGNWYWAGAVDDTTVC